MIDILEPVLCMEGHGVNGVYILPYYYHGIRILTTLLIYTIMYLFWILSWITVHELFAPMSLSIGVGWKRR